MPALRVQIPQVWSRCALRGALDETGLEERRATAADARSFMRELYGEPRAFFTERKVSKDTSE